MGCLNCAREFEGRFCPHSGQRADVGRLTLARMLQPLGEAVNLERGLVHTAVALARRPGATIEDYLAGRRVELASPLKFAAVMVSLALLALWALGLPDGTTKAYAPDLAARMTHVMDRFGSALLLVTVPLYALGTRLCFPARKLNFAEHLAMNAYVFGEQNLVSLVVMPFQHIGPVAAGIAGAFYFAVIVGYFGVVLRRVVARSWWTAALGAVGITIVVYAAFYVLLAAAILWLG